MANDLLQLIDCLKWDRVHLVGASLGGMVCQQFCVLYPYRVLSCSFICTSFGGLSGLPPLNGLYHMIKSSMSKDPDDQFYHSIKALY